MDVDNHPKWGAEGSHCVLCTRPFPTDTELKRHEDRECDRDFELELDCWCEAYCWVTYSGDCIAELEFDGLSEIVGPLRVEVERLREALTRIASHDTDEWHDGWADSHAGERAMKACAQAALVIEEAS